MATNSFPMLARIDRAKVKEAIPKVEPGLRNYLWIQQRYRECDVRRDDDFQTRFKGFYRVRRGSEWCRVYFSLLHKAKTVSLTFDEVLRHLYKKTGRVEASYSSKLVATANPNSPVLDSIVMGHFGLKLPRYRTAYRLAEVCAIYGELVVEYREFMKSQTARTICCMFDQYYGKRKIKALKKVDLVLWQIR